jgi:hypothetical protein
MAKRTLLLAPTLVLALSACAQVPAQDGSASPPPAPAVDATSSAHCDADKATDVVGQLPSQDGPAESGAGCRRQDRQRQLQLNSSPATLRKKLPL